jgi:hypothetical protein
MRGPQPLHQLGHLGTRPGNEVQIAPFRRKDFRKTEADSLRSARYQNFLAAQS